MNLGQLSAVSMVEGVGMEIGRRKSLKQAVIVVVVVVVIVILASFLEVLILVLTMVTRFGVVAPNNSASVPGAFSSYVSIKYHLHYGRQKHF